MPATRLNIEIPSTDWFDLNAASGISAGIPIDIQNIGHAEIQISVSATEPTLGAPNPAYRILKRGDSFRTLPGDPRVWAYVQSTGAYVNIEAVVESEAHSLAAFGEALAEQKTPISQVTAQYGLTPAVRRSVSSGGSASTASSNFVVQSGTNAAGLASITAIRLAKYRAGAGLRCRITALFETGGFANSQHGAGLFTSEDGFLFGYVGTEFGIFRVFGGNDEAQRLTLTVPASGAQPATVTINGIGYVVNLTAGSLAHNAFEIATQLNGVVPDYFITSNGATVNAQANIPGPQGAFAFVSAVAVGSWAQLVAGVVPSFDFVSQSDWNMDKVPWLDKTKGNVYQIAIEYLGYGAIDFFVEEPNSGLPVLVHRMKYANANIVPSVANPIFFMGWIARNTGNTNNIILKGASAACFIDGKIFRSGPSFSVPVNVAAIDTTPTTVLILRVRRHFNSKINRVEILPLRIFLASQTAKACFFNMIVNPTFLGDVVFGYVDEANSVAEISLSNVQISGGVNAGSAIASIGDSQDVQFNLREDSKTIFNPGDTIAIVANMSASPASDVQVSLTWQEDL